MIKFFKEVSLEMQRVSWPNKKEVTGATWVVIVTVLIIALFIWIVDTLLVRLLHLILQ
jgi:preprotein translocase subunit SecE